MPLKRLVVVHPTEDVSQFDLKADFIVKVSQGSTLTLRACKFSSAWITAEAHHVLQQPDNQEQSRQLLFAIRQSMPRTSEQTVFVENQKAKTK